MLDGPLPATNGEPSMVWAEPVLEIRSPITLVGPPATFARWLLEEELPLPPHATNVDTKAPAKIAVSVRHWLRLLIVFQT